MTRLDEMEQDVFVEVIDFKNNTAEELVTKNDDGSYTVFINARAAYNRQQEAIAHAMRHINEDDFEKEDVQQIEAEAHKIVEEAQQPKKRRRRKWEELSPEEQQKSRERRYKRIMKKTFERLEVKSRGYDFELHNQINNDRMTFDRAFFEEHNIFW